jgi:predicted nucleotidyltransferase
MKILLSQLIPEIIAEFPQIQVMYLFGSHASGTSRADSDVDIAVFTDGRKRRSLTWNWAYF